MAANPFYGAVMRLITGVDDRDEVTCIFEGLTLGPVAGRIVAATAILHGETDRLVDGARRLHGDPRRHAAVDGRRRRPRADLNLEDHAFLADRLADHLHAEPEHRS